MALGEKYAQVLREDNFVLDDQDLGSGGMSYLRVRLEPLQLSPDVSVLHSDTSSLRATRGNVSRVL
jgi:hypothetical protein